MIKKSVFIFVIISVVASALNYIIYPLMGRILSSSEYINITVSLSLFTQISTFLSSIVAITIGLSKSNHDGQANEKIELLQAFLFKLFLALAIIFLALSPIIMARLHTPVLFALPISIMMVFSIPVQIVSGYLNGKNQMIKLGLIALISAGSQFAIGLTTSIISRNGLITMISMTIAQMITLTIIYRLFSKDQLPGITKSVQTSLRTIKEKRIGSLIIYTAATSLAIMTISLIQIVDLFIMQNLVHTNIKFYTDIYVVSRIVFFAGMIFIWPFLGEISVDNHHFNRKPFVKLVSYFTIITLAAIVVLYFFGDRLTNILFGAHYNLQFIRNLGILSVLYKYFLLIITAVVLYFVVLRKYIAVWLSLAASGMVFIFSEFINKNSNMTDVLIGLNLIASIVVIIGIIFLFHISTQKNTNTNVINSD